MLDNVAQAWILATFFILESIFRSNSELGVTTIKWSYVCSLLSKTQQEKTPQFGFDIQ